MKVQIVFTFEEATLMLPLFNDYLDYYYEQYKNYEEMINPNIVNFIKESIKLLEDAIRLEIDVLLIARKEQWFALQTMIVLIIEKRQAINDECVIQKFEHCVNKLQSAANIIGGVA